MRPMTNNEIVAFHILGYIPKGYVGSASCSTGAKYEYGIIYQGSKPLCCVPSTLHGGRLPTAQSFRGN